MSDTNTIVCATFDCKSLLRIFRGDKVTVAVILHNKYPELTLDELEATFHNAEKIKYAAVEKK